MSEKVKNRGWVKNVAIIFLAVLLVRLNVPREEKKQEWR